jgi:hypothetical protein
MVTLEAGTSNRGATLSNSTVIVPNGEAMEGATVLAFVV